MALSQSQKGRIIELLVGAMLLKQSEGQLRVCAPLVDDEGVDLIVSNRNNEKTFLLQIKGRFSLKKGGQYYSEVRRKTCAPVSNKLLLFVYYDEEISGLYNTCWLVSAQDFCRKLSGQNTSRPKYVFQSKFNAPKDVWVPFRLSIKDVAAEILKKLK